MNASIPRTTAVSRVQIPRFQLSTNAANPIHIQGPEDVDPLEHIHLCPIYTEHPARRHAHLTLQTTKIPSTAIVHATMLESHKKDARTPRAPLSSCLRALQMNASYSTASIIASSARLSRWTAAAAAVVAGADWSHRPKPAAGLLGLPRWLVPVLQGRPLVLRRVV